MSDWSPIQRRAMEMACKQLQDHGVPDTVVTDVSELVYEVGLDMGASGALEQLTEQFAKELNAKKPS